MTPVWEDPRVASGNARMLELRRRRLASGERGIGWKVAFGSRPAMERLRISAPLIGFFTDANLLMSGSTVSIEEWTKPALEPEIAVHLGADVDPGASAEETAAAIAALGPAIELADVDPNLVDVEEILAGDIYQRHVILGPADQARRGGDARGLAARVLIDGVEAAATEDPIGFCGELIPTVQHAAALLDAAGERLRAGDVLIAGSVVAPIWLEPGHSVSVQIEPLGELSVQVAGAAGAGGRDRT
jgi:2-keto-4-pentenoate hydratase